VAKSGNDLQEDLVRQIWLYKSDSSGEFFLVGSKTVPSHHHHPQIEVQNTPFNKITLFFLAKLRKREKVLILCMVLNFLDQ
jgi:hypothetical protein